jgi:hypothetical protein
MVDVRITDLRMQRSCPRSWMDSDGADRKIPGQADRVFFSSKYGGYLRGPPFIR